MAYRSNPFVERRAERTTSDQEFVRLFSPHVLDRLPDGIFTGAVHIFRSPPGGGKTTVLRAFTPTVLRAFWNSRHVQEMSEAYRRLVSTQVFSEEEGPQLLGVFLSCASGYADLPPGIAVEREGLFRALLDCRTVLRALRSVASLVGFATNDQMKDIRLQYDETATEVSAIPRMATAAELAEWAEQRERTVYAALDSIGRRDTAGMPKQVRFEAVLWLQGVRFIVAGKPVAPRRLLMIDDLHKLRRQQRSMLIEELNDLRPSIPIWLAERNIVLGEGLIAQGTREGRDVHEYALEDLWSAPRGSHQFLTFAQNILDRRLQSQSVVPSGAFAQYLRDDIHGDDVRVEIERGMGTLRAAIERYKSNQRYRDWISHVERHLSNATLDSLRELYVGRILLARDELKRQMTLDLEPLSAQEFEERDSSQVQAAAEVFIHDEFKIPYYFGIERLCTLATSNVEELLSLAAALYEGLEAKQVLRKRELVLSPHEQEKLIAEVARRKRDFIPKNHTEGTRAQRLLDAIGGYCRERTFLPNAPYAPGVTGVRLAQGELSKLTSGQLMDRGTMLRKVLAECVAENLLVVRDSAASTARDSGTVFYLNRTLCCHFGLPLQMGGWQDVQAEDLAEWMERGRSLAQRRLLDAR